MRARERARVRHTVPFGRAPAAGRGGAVEGQRGGTTRDALAPGVLWAVMARRAAAGTPVGARGAKRARTGRGRSGVAVEVGARPATARGAIEVKVEAGAGEYTGPFPSARRPPARDFYAAVRYLAGRHGDPECWIGKGDGCSRFERPRVLDSLVRTILSQNTTDITSQRAFASLNRAYGGDYAKVRGRPCHCAACAGCVLWR